MPVLIVMPQHLRLAAVAAALLALAPTTARAQLTLRRALATADGSAYANRIAAAADASHQARALAPLKGILPSLRLETGFLRGNDPLGAFGALLRQRQVTPAAFDPAVLNYPAAISSYQAGAVAEVPLLNADAWIGRRAARRDADRSGAQLTWTRLGTRVDVIKAYYGAVLATERVTTLEAAARAAHAHVDQAQAMVRQGLVTRSDALLASVRAGDVDAQLAEARGSAVTARLQLSMLLGQDDRPDTALPAALPDAARIRAVAAGDTMRLQQAGRADLAASEAALDAARLDAVRARSTLLPRINAFGRYDWSDAARSFGGDRSWTVGVMASWSLFAGAAEIADVQGSAGRAAAARAGAEAARAAATLEQEQTRTALLVALQRLTIAERGAEQGAEAHRLVTRRYRGGLATAAELLDAHAAETASALTLAHARYGVIVAAAERRRALGGDPGFLTALDLAAPELSN